MLSRAGLALFNRHSSWPSWGGIATLSSRARARADTARMPDNDVARTPDTDSSSRHLAEAVRYLDRLVNYEKKGVPALAGTDSGHGFELGRMHRLVACLGNPLASYKVVHVAGTKGKGSTVAFLASILRAAGLRVGTYTSPHITTICERITTASNGAPIAAGVFASLVRDNAATVDAAQERERGALTHFEVMTALAYVHFAHEKVDIAVIETGLGGVRDATNVIPEGSLSVAVITAIGLEHAAALGGSLEAIAEAKAGIMKASCPAVLARQPEGAAAAVVRQVAAQKGVHLTAVAAPPLPSGAPPHAILRDGAGRPYTVCRLEAGYSPRAGSALHARGEDEQVFSAERLTLGLIGAHQVDNATAAATAVLVLRTQGWPITDKHIREGLGLARLPGRFQVMDPEAAARLGAPPPSTLILDGAHTPDSAAALARSLSEAYPGGGVVGFVVAMASDKDAEGFASALLGGLGSLRCGAVAAVQVPIAGALSRSMPAAKLAASFQRAAGKLLPASETRKPGAEDFVRSRSDLRAAVLQAREMLSRLGKDQQRGEEVLCITGSLHAVGAALRFCEAPKETAGDVL